MEFGLWEGIKGATPWVFWTNFSKIKVGTFWKEGVKLNPGWGNFPKEFLGFPSFNIPGGGFGFPQRSFGNTSPWVLGGLNWKNQTKNF